MAGGSTGLQGTQPLFKISESFKGIAVETNCIARISVDADSITGFAEGACWTLAVASCFALSARVAGDVNFGPFPSSMVRFFIDVH